METAQALHWYEVLKQKLAGYPPFLVDAIIGVPCGIVLGFLLKTFGRYLVIGFFAIICALWFAHHFDIATIDYSRLRALLGVESMSSIQDYITFVTDLVKGHVIGTITFVFGILLGWKLGL